MTRAEVEEEEARLRSKLRDNRWNSYDQRWWTWILPTVVLASVLLSYFVALPDWVYWTWMAIWLIPVSILLPRRFREYSEFERLREEAAKLEYFMCPDCAYHLPKDENGVIVCPECGRQVDVADLKEIWAKRW